MDAWDQHERTDRTYQDGRRDGWREGYEAALYDMATRRANSRTRDDLIGRAMEIMLAKLLREAGR